MSKHTRIACAQLGAINLADSRESVVQRLLKLLEEAAASGARLVVFPELALTTFFPRYWYDEQAEVEGFFEAEMPGPATLPLFETAKRLKVGFHLGYAELAVENGQTRHYNSAILVDDNANIVAKYRKIHLPGHSEHLPQAPYQHLEKRYFDVGNLGFQVWRYLDRVTGMCICNDRRWPETFRVMGLQGAELVVLGYNTPSSNIHHPEPVHLRMFHNMLTMQAAAYQNGIWLVAAAKAGYEDGHGLIGGSCIIAPTGEVAAQCLSEEDELIVVNCDFALGEYIRRTVFNMDKHRRIEHYDLITQRAGPKVEV